jgi:hypothetical protein
MEMSKEEKEAIETFKNIVIQEYDWWIDKGDYAESNVEEANNSIKTILNLIEKQQKEIEETHNKLDKLDNADLTLVYMNGFYDGENKWKDKIKEKIEFYKRYGKVKNSNEYVMCEEIEVLEELLEEE